MSKSTLLAVAMVAFAWPASATPGYRTPVQSSQLRVQERIAQQVSHRHARQQADLAQRVLQLESTRRQVERPEPDPQATPSKP